MSWLHGRMLPYLTGVPVLRYCWLTPQVAIGGQYRRAGRRALIAAGFTASLNLRQELDTVPLRLALDNHCYLPTPDYYAPPLDRLVEGIDFIDLQEAGGGRTYIHCAAGIGRAPLLGAAFLISRGMPLKEALKLIQRRRPFVALHRRQLRQLLRFERSISSAE